jgi:hypothetical protein
VAEEGRGGGGEGRGGDGKHGMEGEGRGMGEGERERSEAGELAPKHKNQTPPMGRALRKKGKEGKFWTPVLKNWRRPCYRVNNQSNQHNTSHARTIISERSPSDDKGMMVPQSSKIHLSYNFKHVTKGLLASNLSDKRI